MRNEYRLSKLEQRVQQTPQAKRESERLYHELRALPAEEVVRLHREYFDVPPTPEQIAYREWLRTLTPEQLLQEHYASL